MAHKTWQEKLHNKKDKLPEVKEITCDSLIKVVGKGTMVIPAPLEIDELMRKVPEGMLITTEDIRKQQNDKYGAVYTCPLCIGIFSKIAAFASEEDISENKTINPYWRTLKGKGEINEKYPGGVSKQIEMLEKEGHKIIARGKKFFVKDYESVLYKFTTFC